MKKLFLALVFAFVGAFAANAQVWIGGSTRFFANSNVTSFSASPEVGYCIPNTRWTVAFATQLDNNVKDVVLSPYVRYSICNIEKFGLFLDLTSEFGVGKNYEGYRIGLQPGVAFNPTKHWTAAFRFAFLGYSDCKFNYDLREKGFDFSFAAAIPAFGLYYNF